MAEAAVSATSPACCLRITAPAPRRPEKLAIKELGVSAKEKAKEIGERRRHRKAEDLNATDRAFEVADELGMDLDEVEGSGSDGRITVRDVQRAASE